MEVHAHAHTPRKKLAHYFWEFLMLFLAVFAGFLAENQREHFIEHQREKQFIKSLISDVKTDTGNITGYIQWYSNLKNACDTVMANFELFKEKYDPVSASSFYDIIGGYPDFIYTDRTIGQLKNSGAMRLIRKRNSADSIIAYDAAVRDLQLEETLVSDYFDKLNDAANRMISFRKVNNQSNDTSGKIMAGNPWMVKESSEQEYLYNLVYSYKIYVDAMVGYLVEIKDKGSRLIQTLQKEYHFE
jgi:hypothetical protein